MFSRIGRIRGMVVRSMVAFGDWSYSVKFGDWSFVEWSFGDWSFGVWSFGEWSFGEWSVYRFFLSNQSNKRPPQSRETIPSS
jgi:hypothetical protein